MIHEAYMQRCLYLARQGAGNVAPNPMVGAVLVYDNLVIGEGYHQHYGQAHAEVNCINSVQEWHKHLIPLATMYVSLEPCAHYGKTPPCADLLIRMKIPLVVIACLDTFKEVAGKGIQKIKDAGIEVITGILEKEGLEINKRFFTFHQKQRPYIVLKWAQTGDHKIAHSDGSRLLISNEKTNRIVHKWRSEEAAILVGTNTALLDDPSLTARLWKGSNPLRLVIDKDLKLPQTLHLFDGTVSTIVFNTVKHEKGKVFYYQLNKRENFIPEMLDALYRMNIQSVLVEGGALLLQAFIDGGYWDEARVITNHALYTGTGIQAPQLMDRQEAYVETMLSDTIRYYINPG